MPFVAADIVLFLPGQGRDDFGMSVFAVGPHRCIRTGQHLQIRIKDAGSRPNPLGIRLSQNVERASFVRLTLLPRFHGFAKCVGDEQRFQFQLVFGLLDGGSLQAHAGPQDEAAQT